MLIITWNFIKILRNSCIVIVSGLNFAKNGPCSPKNVPQNLYIPLLSVNGTPLPCTKNFKSYQVVHISCDEHKNGQIEKVA